MYVNTLAFKPLCNYLKQNGMPDIAHQVMQHAGIHPGQLGSHQERCSQKKFYEAYQLAIRLSDDPLLGLHVGEWLNPSNMGLLGYAMCNCATIKDALFLVLSSNAYGFGNNSINFAISFDGELIRMTLNLQQEAELIRPWIEFTTAGWISHYHHLTNFIHKGQAIFSEVSLPFSSRGFDTEYHRVLGCPVSFDQPQAFITGRPEIFSQEIYTADRSSLNLFMNQLGITPGTSQLEEDLQYLIKESLPNVTTLEQAARKFNISGSTLKRRLKDKGTNFNQISADLKMNMAKQMLRNPSLSINEISYYLGYGKSSAFFRAFKNHCQQTPDQYRKDQANNNR